MGEMRLPFIDSDLLYKSALYREVWLYMYTIKIRFPHLLPISYTDRFYPSSHVATSKQLIVKRTNCGDLILLRLLDIRTLKSCYA